MNATLRVEDVTLRYAGASAPTVQGINLRPEPGTITLLCGASGSGKSSVLRLVNGLIPHFYAADYTGGVAINGNAVSQVPLHEAGRLTSTVFQNPRTQFFTTDVDSELAFAGQNYQLPAAEIRDRASAALETIGVGHLGGRALRGLSGGQLQKIACAQVLAQDTPIVLFDEPTSKLDPDAIRDMAQVLAELKRQGKTIIIAEHRVYFLRGLVDTVHIMERGRIAETMTGEQLFALDDEQAHSRGLRTLREPRLVVPPARPKACEGVHIARLGVSFGATRVLDVRDVGFPAGRVTGITGPNGAGKTTLARVLCGLQKPERGASIRGASASGAFLVMQDVHRQLFADSVKAEADGVFLQRLGLSELADEHPMALSGGQKQRLVIATALGMGAPVLIFDEPTSGVDYRHVVEISQEMKNLARDGKVVIVISHDLEFLNHCADRIITMQPAERTQR